MQLSGNFIRDDFFCNKNFDHNYYSPVSAFDTSYFTKMWNFQKTICGLFGLKFLMVSIALCVRIDSIAIRRRVWTSEVHYFPTHSGSWLFHLWAKLAQVLVSCIIFDGHAWGLILLTIHWNFSTWLIADVCEELQGRGGFCKKVGCLQTQGDSIALFSSALDMETLPPFMLKVKHLW